MKKIMLILAITGILISCSSKDEVVKKQSVAEVVVVEETVIPESEVEPIVEVEKPVMEEADYKTVSEPEKKQVKKTKLASKPMKEKVAVEEEVAEVKTSIDEAIDEDVDKMIAKTETEVKVVEAKMPEEDNKSNKTLFGILGAILVAAAAMFLFKKK